MPSTPNRSPFIGKLSTCSLPNSSISTVFRKPECTMYSVSNGWPMVWMRWPVLNCTCWNCSSSSVCVAACGMRRTSHNSFRFDHSFPWRCHAASDDECKAELEESERISDICVDSMIISWVKILRIRSAERQRTIAFELPGAVTKVVLQARVNPGRTGAARRRCRVSSTQYLNRHAYLLSVSAESACRKREGLIGKFLQAKVGFADLRLAMTRCNQGDCN